MKNKTFLMLCIIAALTAPLTFNMFVFAGKQLNSPEVWINQYSGEVVKIIGTDGNLLPWTDDLSHLENGYVPVFVDGSLSKDNYYK